MVSRMLSKTKERLCFFLIIVAVSISIAYLYLMYIQENFRNVQWSEKRCLSELTSVKSQLNVVTEYKNRIEKVLSDTQKSHKADKDKFRDVMESFKAMEQQSAICQSQYEDVKTECKKCRESYNQANRETLQLKGQYLELQKAHEKLQNSVKEQYNFIDTLRNENARLQDSLRAQAVSSNFEPSIRHYNNKSFAHLLEVNDGVYKIDVKNNMKAELNNKFPWVRSEEKSVDGNNQLIPPNKMNIENRENMHGEAAPNAIPPGFPPILSVLENVNSNLLKPLEDSQKQNDYNKQNDVFKVNENNKQQAIDDPVINKVDAFENNANMPVIDINDGIKINEKESNMADHNQNIEEEDEDDGEEYPT